MVKKVPVTKMVYETSTGKQFEDRESALDYEFNILTGGGNISSAYQLRRFLISNSEFIKELMDEE